ncbi:MAG: glycine cleavage system protein GcvH [Planctomycetes bacterium]|nr:glycine cleavage system protein GcvH [Planctomycetota bacterium]
MNPPKRSPRPENLRYRETHEWLRVEGAEAVVGITDFAVEHLSDLVHLQLPRTGARFRAGEVFGEVESVKAVSELYAPVDGEVMAVNGELPDDLDRLARDPFGEGWMVRLRMADPAQARSLLGASDYESHARE